MTQDFLSDEEAPPVDPVDGVADGELGWSFFLPSW